MVFDTIGATKKVPNMPVLLERNTEFPSTINLIPFPPPDLDMRVDSPALSEMESRHSRRTLGGGWSHIESREEALWVMPHSERHRFPHPFKVSPYARATLQMTFWDEVTTRRVTDTPAASSGRSCRFQIQLDKWPDTP